MGKSPNAAISRPGTTDVLPNSPSPRKPKKGINSKESKTKTGSELTQPIFTNEESPHQRQKPDPGDQIRIDDYSHLLALAEKLLVSPNINLDNIFEQIRVFIPYDDAVILRYSEGGLNCIGYVSKEKRSNPRGAALMFESPELFESFWHRLPSARTDQAGEVETTAEPLLELRQWGLTDILAAMNSQIWAPLFNQNRLLGCLGFGCSAPNAFTDYHANLAQRTAGLVAAALANSDNFSQVQHSAALEERKNLARSLHDAINQSLFSAGLIAEVLPHVWNKDQAEGAKSLEDLRRLIRGAQAEIRIILVELRHSPTIDVEIADLLHLLANAFTGRTNIPVDEDILKDNSLPPKIRTAYYHLCQEALNNIVKHAKATRVQLSFDKQDDRYILSIKDDGIGFDRRRKGIRREKKEFDAELRDKGGGFNPKYIPPGHYGLRMMNEMANSVGAEMKIETRPGFGTSISIYWQSAPQKEEEKE